MSDIVRNWIILGCVVLAGLVLAGLVIWASDKQRRASARAERLLAVVDEIMRVAAQHLVTKADLKDAATLQLRLAELQSSIGESLDSGAPETRAVTASLERFRSAAVTEQIASRETLPATHPLLAEIGAAGEALKSSLRKAFSKQHQVEL